ncbi:MAG TPA: hypothetical protein PLW35_13745, partial [Verrucomicrobiota bacterium]|nr:hypothetical protein [Verrucomicrobiota bacterium]
PMRRATHRCQTSAFTRKTKSFPGPDSGAPALYPCAKGPSAALRPNYVSVPVWPRSISPLIPMVSHALPRMHCALVAAKRLDAVGAGRREALGVRQLAAALLLCANNVSGTRSA